MDTPLNLRLLVHWIIQSNLFADEDALRLREALGRLDTPYTDVKLIPIACELEHIPKVEGPVFVYGTTYIHRSAYDQGWWPGYIGGQVDYQRVSEGYGEQMLNADATYVRLGDLSIPEGTLLFVRPDNDAKLFTGAVLDQKELDQLRTLIVGQQGASALDECAVVSIPKHILSEVRCIVVDGTVVTASYYRRGGKVFHSNQVDERILEYAQQQVDIFCPDIGFSLDIADTQDGLRVIEVNALSSCGLYACDLNKFANAINALGDGPIPVSDKPKKVSP